MERIITLQVQAEELPVTVGEFLRKRVNLSSRQISRLKFQKRGIFVNGMAARVNQILQSADEITICLEEPETGSQHLIATPGHVDIRYEDEDLLVVNKSAGVPVHPSHGHYGDTLANHLVDYYRRRGKELLVRPVGRLDKDTSGLVLFAKNQVAAARLSANKKALVQKEYLALVNGCPKPLNGSVRLPIAPLKGTLNQMVTDQDGKAAVTHYEVIKEMKGCSLLRLWLEHGRTHQIRVHMAKIGHPLLGDEKYGTTGKLTRAALHCEKIRLLQPFSGEYVEVTAPIPEDMERIIENGTIEL